VTKLIFSVIQTKSGTNKNKVDQSGESKGIVALGEHVEYLNMMY
jgi:hypothetical protein